MLPPLIVVLALSAAAPADETNGLRCSVVGLGDVNGDGKPDLALARRGTGPGGFFGGTPPGSPGLGIVWILSGADGTPLARIEPPRPDALFGRSLARLGDVTGDTVAELAVAGSGCVWVLSPTDGRVVHELSGSGGGSLGQPLAGGQDLDGDGAPDLLVYQGSGTASVFSGQSGACLLRLVAGGSEASPGAAGEPPTLRLPCTSLAGPLAWLPRRADDQGPGIALIVNARLERARGDGATRPLLLMLGPTGQLLARAELPDDSHQDTPWEVRALDDVDADDVADVAVTMIHDFTLVYSGTTGALLRRHSYQGHYLCGEGASLAAVGDLDGDGVGEYLVGANEDGLDCDPGMVVVHSGATGEALRSKHYGYFDDSCGPGVDACPLRDVDGDGLEEVVLHLPRLQQALVLGGRDFEPLWRVDLRSRAYDAAASTPEEGDR